MIGRDLGPREALLSGACVCLAFCVLIGCSNPGAYPAGPVTLVFSLSLDPEVYSRSHYKKPPQFAIWIEDEAGDKIRTVWVTEKTGTGSWGGDIVRPVSLPYWVSRWNKETGSSGDPTPEKPAADAVTGATPKQDLTCRIEVPAATKWNYFVEVNVSGDFNDSFPAESKGGRRNSNGNGQPSIIYKGQIRALPGRRSEPKLIGRTHQFEAVSDLNLDLTGMSSAKDLFSKIELVVE
ncbi:MAG: hypothetical protein ACYTBS_13095 [Planctomycetota bacterium]